MKKIILLLSVFLAGFAFAQTSDKNQVESKLSKLSNKNNFYKDYKKQLVEQNKLYQDEKRKKGITADTSNNTEGDVVDFSTGKPVKK